MWCYAVTMILAIAPVLSRLCHDYACPAERLGLPACPSACLSLCPKGIVSSTQHYLSGFGRRSRSDRSWADHERSVNLIMFRNDARCIGLWAMHRPIFLKRGRYKYRTRYVCQAVVRPIEVLCMSAFNFRRWILIHCNRVTAVKGSMS